MEFMVIFHVIMSIGILLWGCCWWHCWESPSLTAGMNLNSALTRERAVLEKRYKEEYEEGFSAHKEERYKEGSSAPVRERAVQTVSEEQFRRVVQGQFHKGFSYTFCQSWADWSSDEEGMEAQLHSGSLKLRISRQRWKYSQLPWTLQTIRVTHSNSFMSITNTQLLFKQKLAKIG